MITPYIVKDDRLQDKGDEHRQGYNRTEQQNEIVLTFNIVTGFDGERVHDYVTPLLCEHDSIVATLFTMSTPKTKKV